MLLRNRFLKVGIDLKYFVIIFPFLNEFGHSFEEKWIPITSQYFMPSFIDIGLVVLKKIFKSCQCVFHNHLPLVERCGLLFEKKTLNPLHPCANFGWNWPSSSGEDFWKSSICFYFFIIIFWKGMPLNLNLLYTTMLFAKFGLNWPGGKFLSQR